VEVFVSVTSSPAPQRLTLTTWLILAMAAIGFSCDIFVLLMLQPVLPPALAELLPGVTAGSPEFRLWRGLMFWVPAMAGGVFGLLGGYLTDRLGRRRVLTWSILLYAFSSFAAGYATSMPMLLVLRSLTFIGVCVEFVAAVAWLAELFPNHEQRERALGYTQAFSSFGGLLAGGVFLLAGELAKEKAWNVFPPDLVMPDFLAGMLGTIAGPRAPWRYTLIAGVLPAIPLIVIRPFLPESPIWQQKKQAGTLKRPSLGELFAPRLRRTTLLTTFMVACSYGIAFGAIQQVPQIVPGLPEVKAEVATALQANQDKLTGLQGPQLEQKKRGIASPVQGKTAGQLQVVQEVGGLLGRFLLAMLVVRIVSRQRLLRLFQAPALVLVPLVFVFAGLDNHILFTVGDWRITTLHVGIFFVGLLATAQFSFWGNYLPVVYPVHLRGTGESVAANIGGRMIGTSFAAVTSLLSGFAPGDDDPTRMAYTAAGVGFAVVLANFVASFFLPEPKAEMLTE
jgi:MFS family permease